MSIVASVVNLVRSQVYHNERPPLQYQYVGRDAARRAGSSATADILVLYHDFFISYSLYKHCRCYRFILQIWPTRLAVSVFFASFSPGRAVKYCDQRVCMSVCPPRITQKPHSKLHEIFCVCVCYLWPWLGPFLATVQYVMYFRFCG